MQRQVQANKDLPVIYIGTKEIKHEKTYGTQLRFTRGQTHGVISPIAMQMLNHKGVYTTLDTPELAKFIEENPDIAALQGLIELPQKELDALIEKAQQAAITLADNSADESDITIEVNGGQEALDSTQIEDVITEINACVNKGQLKEWAEMNQLQVSHSGTREEIEARLLEAYKAKNMDV